MAVIKNPTMNKSSKPPAHAASEEDVKRVLVFITTLDLEPGYPCAHKKIPLYVVGDNQGSTWKQLHSDYEKSCQESQSRVLSCNRFREYVQHYLPSIKLGKTQTDLCNECYAINLQLKSPDVSEDEKIELKLKLGMHLDEANTQRRAMNAYIAAVKKKIAPDDPPLRFEPCFIPAVEDEILSETLDLFKNSPNPVFLDCQVGEGDVDNDPDGVADNEANVDDQEGVVDVQTGDLNDQLNELVFNVVSEDVQSGEVMELTNDDPASNDEPRSMFLHSVWAEEEDVVQHDAPGEGVSPADEPMALPRGTHHPGMKGDGQESNLSSSGLTDSSHTERKENDTSEIKLLTQEAKKALVRNLNQRTVDRRDEFAKTLDKRVVAKMDLEIEDFGQEKLLPSFKLRKPGADYFNSSLNIRNMNFINLTVGGQSQIYLYDERTGGKGGNEVCSIRWHNLMKNVNSRSGNNLPLPIYHVSVLDNCTGQNKSNTAFKFEALQTTLGIFKTKTKLFLKPGHSHNQSDVITGESNKYLNKKDLFTIDQISTEMNASKNVDVSVLKPGDFFEWENFLDKFFKDMPVGFTKFYCYEFIDGSVAMKRLCTETPDDKVVVKELLKDPKTAKSVILKELFDLPPSATINDIFNATLKLPKLPKRELKQTKLDSIAKKFPCIPTEYLSFYPGGEAFLKKKSSDEPEVSMDDTQEVCESLVTMKPKRGRPKVHPKTQINTQSIIRFFCAPKIPVSSVGEVSTSTNTLAPFGTRNLKFGSSSPPKPIPTEQPNLDNVADIINIGDENDFDENENRAKKKRTDTDILDNRVSTAVDEETATGDFIDKDSASEEDEEDFPAVEQKKTKFIQNLDNLFCD